MRRTAILLFLGLILGLHPAPWVHAAPFQAILDSYGGDERSPCPNGSTGFFYTYRDPATKHWWYCDPRGNRFFALSMEVIHHDVHLQPGLYPSLDYVQELAKFRGAMAAGSDTGPRCGVISR